MPGVTPPKRRSWTSNLAQAAALGAALQSGGAAPTRSTLTPTEQTSRANQLQNSKAQRFQAGAESQSSMLNENYNRSGTPGQAKPAQFDATPNDTDELAARQAKDRAISRAEKKVSDDKTGLKDQLVGGSLLHIIERFVPGVGFMLEKLHGAGAEERLEILQDIHHTLVAARTAAGLADGGVTWLRIFVPSISTIILPLLMLAIFVPWILIYMLFGKSLGGTFSLGVQKIIEMIEPMIKDAEGQVNKKRIKLGIIGRLEQLRTAA